MVLSSLKELTCLSASPFEQRDILLYTDYLLTNPRTEKKTIEYSGQEIAGITIYWNVNTALTPGDYTVEIFADNYRLTSRKFTLK